MGSERPEGVEPVRGFAIVSGKEYQWVEPGICFDVIIGLLGEPSAGQIGGELLGEKLPLIIANISGQENMASIGTKQHGRVAGCVAGSMDQKEVIVAGKGACVSKERLRIGGRVCVLEGG